MLLAFLPQTLQARQGGVRGLSEDAYTRLGLALGLGLGLGLGHSRLLCVRHGGRAAHSRQLDRLRHLLSIPFRGSQPAKAPAERTSH